MNERLKLILLTDVLENTAGGAERQIYELLKGIDKNKFHPYLFILHHKSIPEEIAELGMDIETIGIKRIYSLNGILEGMKFARYLKDNKIDILMTYHFGSDIWGTICGKAAGVRVIVSNRRDIGFWRKNYHISLYRFIDNFVNVIVTNSHKGRELIIKQEKQHKNKVKVIYNGVDVQKFSNNTQVKAMKEKLGFKACDFIIGSVGNLRPVKGHKYLIEAAALVIRESPEAKFMIAGEGPLKEDLKNIAENLGIKDKVVFLGKRDDIAELISIMDICVLSSLSESSSNAVLEYMAAGKPVVATDVGGNSELICDQKNGLLVPAGDSVALKRAIMDLIKNNKKALDYGKIASTTAREKFSLCRMIAGYEDFFIKKSRIKILHLISSGGLFGAENVLLDLARLAEEKGFPVTVGAIRNRHNPHTEVIEKAENLGLKTVVFDSNASLDFNTVYEIKSFLRKNYIDIIHTHNYKSDILGFFASMLAHKKWIATNHVWHGLDFKLKCYELADAFILKFAHRVVAVSDGIERDLIKRRISRIKIRKIYNGIDLRPFTGNLSDERLRKELGVLPGEIVVGSVGRLSPEKGHKTFLEAAKIIAETYTGIKIKFIIVGDGPLRIKLEQQAKMDDLNKKVIFTGIRNDMPKIYSVINILVNASYIEGLPLIILEAMASGVAVIATKVGAVPEVIRDNESGILIDPGDPHGLTAAITELSENEQKRNTFALNAYKVVREKFSAERMACEYIGTYKELLN